MYTLSPTGLHKQWDVVNSSLVFVVLLYMEVACEMKHQLKMSFSIGSFQEEDSDLFCYVFFSQFGLYL